MNDLHRPSTARERITKCDKSPRSNSSSKQQWRDPNKNTLLEQVPQSGYLHVIIAAILGRSCYPHSKMQLGQSIVVCLVAFWQVIDFSTAEYLLQTFTGSVGSGNSTFYKLTREGRVRLVLESTYGDTDLYVSDKSLHPDYTNYELHSGTCGEDQVEIPEHFQRPVGIAVYGHPSIEESKYQLSVFIDSSSDYTNGPNSAEGYQHHQKRTQSFSKDEGEESVLWTIFVGILKIIFDILM